MDDGIAVGGGALGDGSDVLVGDTEEFLGLALAEVAAECAAAGDYGVVVGIGGLLCEC